MQIKHIQHKLKIRQIPTELNYYHYLHKQQKAIIKQVAINRIINISIILIEFSLILMNFINKQMFFNFIGD